MERSPPASCCISGTGSKEKFPSLHTDRKQETDGALTIPYSILKQWKSFGFTYTLTLLQPFLFYHYWNSNQVLMAALKIISYESWLQLHKMGTVESEDHCSITGLLLLHCQVKFDWNAYWNRSAVKAIPSFIFFFPSLPLIMIFLNQGFNVIFLI